MTDDRPGAWAHALAVRVRAAIESGDMAAREAAAVAMLHEAEEQLATAAGRRARVWLMLAEDGILRWDPATDGDPSMRPAAVATWTREAVAELQRIPATEATAKAAMLISHAVLVFAAPELALPQDFGR